MNHNRKGEIVMIMNRLSRLIVFSACVVALATQMPTAAQSKGQKGSPPGHTGTRVSVSPVHVFHPLQEGPLVNGAGSQLVRSKDGVFMTFHSQGLAPGTVATAWWVFFNDPKECATDPCRVADLLSNPASQPSLLYAAGRIVGPDGALDLGSFRAAGDTTGGESFPPFPATNPGLLDPKRAEIHIVIRTHGPALTGGALAQQLTTFNGGCPPNTCANVQVSIHQP
jgi:hypothetical protein